MGVRDVSEASSWCGRESSTHGSISVWRQQWCGLRQQSKVVDKHVVTLVTILHEETVSQRVVAYHVLHLHAQRNIRSATGKKFKFESQFDFRYNRLIKTVLYGTVEGKKDPRSRLTISPNGLDWTSWSEWETERARGGEGIERRMAVNWFVDWSL